MLVTLTLVRGCMQVEFLKLQMGFSGSHSKALVGLVHVFAFGESSSAVLQIPCLPYAELSGNAVA